MLGLMHIPDGFLAPTVAAATWAVSAATVGAALRAERRDPQPMPAGILGSLAAFVFAAQMINVPVAAGTSGHLLGATLAVMIVGPWRAILVLAIVLAVQAVLFQDGGIAALGANLFDMGVAAPLAGYAGARLAGRLVDGTRGLAAGAVLGAFGATLAAATLTAAWLALSGLYPLKGILPALLLTHVAIGILEAGLTGAIIATLLRWRPDLVRGLDREPARSHSTPLALGLLAIGLAIAAFVAPFASTLPDGFDHTAERLGLAGRATALMPAPFPDYLLPLPVSAGVAVAAAGLIGTLLVAAIAWAVSRRLAAPSDAVHR